MKKNNLIIILVLHILLMIYSCSGICSKFAAGYPFMSKGFCLYYGIVIALLGIYAIVWQQIINRLPLTTAFANKAVSVVWGIIWGALIFHEEITMGKVAGALLVIIGVIMYVTDKEGQPNG